MLAGLCPEETLICKALPRVREVFKGCTLDTAKCLLSLF